LHLAHPPRAAPGYSIARETDDSRKVRFAQTHRTIRAGWFAQQGMICAILWMFRASKLLCCVSFKLSLNYFIYLIFHLCVGIASCWC